MTNIFKVLIVWNVKNYVKEKETFRNIPVKLVDGNFLYFIKGEWLPGEHELVQKHLLFYNTPNKKVVHANLDGTKNWMQ
jgi:hypothetical protein